MFFLFVETKFKSINTQSKACTLQRIKLKLYKMAWFYFILWSKLGVEIMNDCIMVKQSG